MKTQESIPLITTATSLASQEKKVRTKKYFLLMSFRIPALLAGTIIAYTTHLTWLAVLIVGLSIPLPWIAVLLANDRLPVKHNKKIAIITTDPGTTLSASNNTTIIDTDPIEN